VYKEHIQITCTPYNKLCFDHYTNHGPPKGCINESGRTVIDMESEGMPCSLGFHIFDLVLKLDILMSCFQLEDFNNIDEVWV
jgi:hypothetical protein